MKLFEVHIRNLEIRRFQTAKFAFISYVVSTYITSYISNRKGDIEILKKRII